MNSTRRTARGRCLKNIIQSDINNKSTCLTLNIPHEIACHTCQPKLCVLTTRRVNKKTKSERQKSKRNRCQQMWDSYWTNLSNATTGQLMTHRKQRLYLGVEPDVIINNYSIFEDDNDNELNDDEAVITEDKQVPSQSKHNTCIGIPNTSKHDTHFQEDTQVHLPEKRNHVSIACGTKDTVDTEDTTEDTPFNITLTSFLKSTYPRKYRNAENSWSKDLHSRVGCARHLSRLYSPFLLTLRVLSGNIALVAASLIHMVLERNVELRDEVPADTIDKQIVDSIKEFMNTGVTEHGGRTTNELREAKDAVLTACLSSKNISKNQVRERLGVSRYTISKIDRTSETITYSHSQPKQYVTASSKLMRDSIYDFCHSEESSTIDSNSRKIIEVNGERHVGRVWLVPTVREQYKLFMQSDVMRTYQNMYTKYVTPSQSFFYHHRCKCVSRPVMQSCVDLRTSSLWHYMQALAKYVRVNASVREEIKNSSEQHDWLAYLTGRVDTFVDSTCCKRESHPHLKVGAGSSDRTPKLLKWACVNNTCLDCGVEKKQGIKRCKILSESSTEIKVMQWILAERQGVNKSTGRKNTQLELGVSTLTVKEVVKKLIAQLNIVREHQAQYEWRNQMFLRDRSMSKSDTHRVLFTDFGATLDLMAAEKDNSSVNNHAVICIFFVCSNWRLAKFKNQVEGSEDVFDETIVNDCDRWIFFGDTQSKGKKNDHIFHNACTTHIIKFYDSERVQIGKDKIPFNVIWTDNCPTQYKCRQNFWKVASSGKHNESVIVHKFAQKYRFKGSWDATGKIVKEAIRNSELRYERCATAFDCYMKMKHHLTRNGNENSTQKLLEYEATQDARVVQNTPFRCRRTYIGLGTESIDEYNTLKEHNEHIVFTNRNEKEDMNAVSETMKISQVNGDINPLGGTSKEKWVLTSSHLPCSCPSCHIHPSSGACIYKEERNIVRQIVNMKVTTDKEKDEFGVSQMLVKDLKFELSERGLKHTGNKAELAARLLLHFRELSEENGELAPINDDTDLPLPLECNPTSTGATVVNGHATDAPLPVAALPLFTGATVINGHAADAPLPVAALPLD